MLDRWKRKRGARAPEGNPDAGQAQDSGYTADPRELVGPEAVTVAGSPEGAGERRAEEP